MENDNADGGEAQAQCISSSVRTALVLLYLESTMLPEDLLTILTALIEQGDGRLAPLLTNGA